jgi:hypothetical protein
MKKHLLALPVIALYILHQDIWFWKTARPLVFGFLPIGLFYHGCFSIAACLLMVLLVRCAWPSEIEEDVERAVAGARGREPGSGSSEPDTDTAPGGGSVAGSGGAAARDGIASDSKSAAGSDREPGSGRGAVR